MSSVLLEGRSYRPFKSSEEYLYAMREDLAEWLNILYPDLQINVSNFMDRLDTGVALCKHANNVRHAAEEYIVRRQARHKSMTKSITSGLAGPVLNMGNVHFLPAAKSGTFFARDNVSNFISWCRKSLQIFECLLFETDDLIMRKNEKHVILCLLEVARRGAKFGMLAPMLVQMERQIDREIAADNKANFICKGITIADNATRSILETEIALFESDSEEEDDPSCPVLMYGPQQQIITNDLKSLDEMVRDLVAKCTCPSQFPMIRVSEGKYRIGDTKVLIFVRILRSHVMVRVGGGWDTLSHYLDKHDPCRCKAQHRSSVAARIISKSSQSNNGIELHKAQVVYERLSAPFWKQQSNVQHCSLNSEAHSDTLLTPVRTRSRSRSPAHPKTHHNPNIKAPAHEKGFQVSAQNFYRRSPSPSPRRLDTRKKKNIQELVCRAKSKTSSNEGLMRFDCEQNESVINEITLGASVEDKYNKYESTSDNGSELSDEGYRSLGITHSGTVQSQKRIQLQYGKTDKNSEDRFRLDPIASNLAVTILDERNQKSIDKDSGAIDEVTSKLNVVDQITGFCDLTQGSDNRYIKSGIAITDKETTINTENEAGFTKKEFPPSAASTFKSVTASKIPVSPEPRRRESIEDVPAFGKLATMNRKIPTYRSLRKTNQSSENAFSDKPHKQRPILSAETFAAKPNPGQTNCPPCNSPSRSIMYGKTNSKHSHSSALAQQLIEATTNAHNDSQIISKVKELLSKYSDDVKQSTTIKDADDECTDSTEQWVKNTETINHTACHTPNDESEQSSTVLDESDGLSGNKIQSTTSISFVRGLSKIPAPVRSNTGQT